MPWRLILFIVVFAIFLVFVTFNLDNRCDISFGFAKFSGVPVFLTVFISFVVGLFCALPLARILRKKHKEKPSKVEKPKEDNFAGEVPPEPVDARTARRRFLSRRKNTNPNGGQYD
ncbi:MAG: hypothetical protein LBI28_14770 [Treponema sp.]|nr:hypothetical protein [Treponema sp.]